jgi:hypothetical protein
MEENAGRAQINDQSKGIPQQSHVSRRKDSTEHSFSSELEESQISGSKIRRQLQPSDANRQ